MNTTDLLRIRLYNQLLDGKKFKTPEEIVSYMGAMQSQSFEMAKWAIGIRLPGSTNLSIEEALNNGKIIRTHILRPTWHFVSAEDIHWMIDLSAPRLKNTFLTYGKMLRIENDILKKTIPLIETALLDNNHLTRQEISAYLNTKGLNLETNALSHLMRYAELDGLVCSGKFKGNRQSYCLLEELVPRQAVLCHEEALEKLARKFFTSHGPATLHDFIWWSGLKISDAKKALELIKDDFITEEINGRIFYFKNDIQIPDNTNDSLLLLPPFDEYVVSYKDRSEIVDDENYGKVMTKNGLFSPTVMYNGRIVGSWKKIKNKDKTDIELSFFKNTKKHIHKLFGNAVQSCISFYHL